LVLLIAENFVIGAVRLISNCFPVD
jgi:hypothetical protein